MTTQALITLTDEANRLLNIIKAKYNMRDKSQAVEAVIEHYIECAGEPDFHEEFIERIKRAEKGKFIRINNFAKHYGAE